MKNKSEAEYHQADFDAFITGIAFCYLVTNYIDNNGLIYNYIYELNINVVNIY